MHMHYTDMYMQLDRCWGIVVMAGCMHADIWPPWTDADVESLISKLWIQLQMSAS